MGIFSDDCFVHLTFNRYCCASADGRSRPLYIYTINGSAVRAFPNESEYTKQTIAIYSYLFIYQYASCIAHETTACIKKHLHDLLWMIATYSNSFILKKCINYVNNVFIKLYTFNINKDEIVFLFYMISHFHFKILFFLGNCNNH